MKFTNQDGPVTILHVDDDPAYLDLATSVIEAEYDHFSILQATSGEEGLEVFKRENVDCIVSDFDMPGKDGLEFLEAVRELDCHVPFFLLTGKGSEEIASEAISAGVTDYLQKQRGMEHYTLLANRIEIAVERHRSRVAARETRRFFSKLIEYSTDVIPVLEPDGTIKYVSPSCRPILGYEQAAVIGDSAFEYIHPDDVETSGEQFSKAIENPDSMPEVEFRFRHADGSWLELRGRAINLLDDPDIGGIVSYNRVIGEVETGVASRGTVPLERELSRAEH